MPELATLFAGMTPGAWAMLVFAMLCGGLVKGVHGIGLPLVSVPILSAALPVQTAIAVTLLPVLVTNAYQIRLGRDVLPIARRFALLLAGLVVGILAGVYMLANLSTDFVTVILGVIVLCFVVLRLCAPRWRLGARGERVCALPVGLTAGVIGGVSSLYGIPVTIFLSTLGLDRQTFVRTIGLVFVTGMVPLYAAFTAFEIQGPREIALSLVALVPVFIGYLIGERLRGIISEVAFQRGFTVLLAALGVTLLYRGISALL
ncbi:sulfite exporter TauE/SafE family protein [Marivibrio halodurans]|uniref:Probable membrane transporter protein n=1 Tax=Marivibrio halodurans TaxID=2039722 RepID=A0A8J7V547_9PROT|nr:sulfite exporter TauE/SafE family protein [Marivibrio halodurans]MBP5858454.1 sulfite exporter TauE/SafE family protein [Marivibrio halodurans]